MKHRRRNLLLVGLTGLAFFATVSAQADAKGEKILQEAFRKLHEAQSLTADLVTERKMTGQPTTFDRGAIALKKPNYLNVTLTRQIGPRIQKQTSVSDGTYYFRYSEGDKNYLRQPADRSPRAFDGDWEGEVNAFFGEEAGADKLHADFAGTETLDGVPCDLIRILWKQEEGNRILTYAIGQKDRLIRRSSCTCKVEENDSLTQTNHLKNIQLNGPVTTSAFAFVPPRDIPLYDPQEARKEKEAKLLAVGQEAPAFEWTDPKTKMPFSLAGLLQGRKAVLVNFWFCHCNPCREEFPHLQKMFEELKEKGLGLIAVNGMDSDAVINKYVQEKKFTFRIGMAARNEGGMYEVGRKYGVSAYPTNYVIDASGKVIWRGIGFDEAAIRKALAEQGIQ
jgi:peroxiredoxin/outer membrane lipoprotein-sorting protein